MSIVYFYGNAPMECQVSLTDLFTLYAIAESCDAHIEVKCVSNRRTIFLDIVLLNAPRTFKEIRNEASR